MCLGLFNFPFPPGVQGSKSKSILSHRPIIKVAHILVHPQKPRDAFNLIGSTISRERRNGLTFLLSPFSFLHFGEDLNGKGR